MLEYLRIENVGPAAQLELEFAPRLNLITGDNGLGKTFLLDVAWFSAVGYWPADVNHRLTSGRMALPITRREALITVKESVPSWADGGSTRELRFVRSALAWEVPRPMPEEGRTLVLYAQVDGSFSVWDPARNVELRPTLGGHSPTLERPRAYVFSPSEVWDGLRHSDGTQLCNGLIGDWGSWQKEKGVAFERLIAVLEQLSPDSDETLVPGGLTRVSLDDVRDIPTLTTLYEQEVPVVFASAGVRRIIALAYLLVWTWEEHIRACDLLNRPTTSALTFLVDEIEAHLHPRWQRTVLKSLVSVAQFLSPEIKVQLIAATHSPLVMASAEPWFDPAQDAWFDLDLVRDNGHSNVTLTKRPFQRRGGASRWLQSEAFDLPEDGSVERERALLEARQLLADPKRVTDDAVRDVDMRLRGVLSEIDPFWIRWSAFAEPFVLKSP